MDVQRPRSAGRLADGKRLAPGIGTGAFIIAGPTAPHKAAMAARYQRIALFTVLLTTTIVAASTCETRADTPDGRSLYQRHCAACHGPTGRGDGPNAALFSISPRNLHDGLLSRYSTEDLVRRVRTGRSLELALDLPALRARAAEVEAVVAHMKRLPELDWPLIDEGWGIYMQRCEQCHGRFGRPSRTFPAGVRAPRPLGDPEVQSSMNDAALADAIRHGAGGMPAPTPRPTADEVQLLVAFIRVLSPGFEIYSQYCAGCHGDSGSGVPALDAALPTVTFDTEYFAHTNPEHLRRSVWHMMDQHRASMPHFRRTITEAEARSIIAYLRSQEQPAAGQTPPAAKP